MNLLLHQIDACTRTAMRDPLLVAERRTCWLTVWLSLAALALVVLAVAL